MNGSKIFIKLFVYRIISYPVVTLFYFFVKNILQNNEFGLSKQDFSSLISVIFVLTIMDLCSVFFLYKTKWRKSVLIHHILLFSVLLFVSVIGIKIELLSVVIIVCISSVAWGISLFISKKIL